MGMFDFLGGGGGNTSTQTVATWEAPQWSWNEGMQKTGADFVTSNINRMNQGKYPAYYENALPTLRENMSRPLRESTFGTPGYRGQSLMGQAGEEGAMYGLGPKSTVARKRKVMSDYQSKDQAINEYLTQLGVNIMNTDATRMPQLLQGFSQGPNAQPVTLTSTSGGSSGIGSMLGGMPWGDIFGSMGNIFGGGGGNMPTGNFQSTQSPWGNTLQNSNNQMSYNNITGQNYGGYSW